MKNKNTHLVLVTESKSEHLQQKAEYIFAPSYTIMMDNLSANSLFCNLSLNDTLDLSAVKKSHT